MIMGPSQENREGLNLLRVTLVISSISPLFFLWAVKGVAILADIYFVPVCLFLAIFPTIILVVRERIATRQRDAHPLQVGSVEDHRGHVLIYLFAMLLPFYRQVVDGWRELSALILALIFIVFLFWHLNFHYMNILFAIRRYHVFTVYPPQHDNKYASSDSYILVTRRRSLRTGQSIVALRLSNTVYLEKSP